MLNIQAEKIVSIVRTTRNFSLPKFGNVEDKGYKTDNSYDVVTQVDQDIENFLKTELQKIYPDIPFVWEEFWGNREMETYWLADPIDGTGHFIRGIPYCTTMLALVHRQEVIFSVIYDFVHDVIYHAEKWKGAYQDGKRLHVSTRSLSKSYLIIETNSKYQKNRDIESFIKDRSTLMHHICSGYDFILVASGKIEGRIVYDGFGMDYDFAPGTLLVSEAGGVVKSFDGKDFTCDNLNFIASNQQVYEELMDPNTGISASLSLNKWYNYSIVKLRYM